MKLLYISTLSSNQLIQNIYENTKSNPGFAIQKFNRLIVDGLSKNGIDISILSSPPIPRSMKIWVHLKPESENALRYRYIPYINFRVIKNFSLFLNTFIGVLKWRLNNKGNNYVIFDVLNISISLGGLMACKLLKLNTLGIVTDLPNLMLRGGAKRTFWTRIADYINNSYISNFSSYVFLTQQMNEVVNKNNRPYIIMEGLAEVDMSQNCTKIREGGKKILMYAGGLHERYGLNKLVEAFINLNNSDWELLIYGDGPYVEKLRQICQVHQNVIYKGVVPNDEIIIAEKEATILVNPRPTNEIFTQYSFPSKNIEYMLSGTPLLTTKLPGMPSEYYKYIYTFKDESSIGFVDTLRDLFETDDNSLNDTGLKARKFIIENKNNIVQTQRLIGLLKSL